MVFLGFSSEETANPRLIVVEGRWRVRWKDCVSIVVFFKEIVTC